MFLRSYGRKGERESDRVESAEREREREREREGERIFMLFLVMKPSPKKKIAEKKK